MRGGRTPVILLFFPEATLSEVTAALDEVAEPFQMMNADPVVWFFPDANDWHVLARPDDKALESYTEEERQVVRAEVGAAPAAILSLTLSRNVISEACDAAKMLALHLLGRFEGVVDDRSGEDSIWNVKEIRTGKAGVKFLQCYRGE